MRARSEVTNRAGSTAVAERVQQLIEPVVVARGLELVDVEYNGGRLVVTLDSDGGVGTDDLADASRTISRVLDTEDPVPSRYTLEVSSPGLERSLRRPAHFQRAIGATVRIKTRPDVDGERRLDGQIISADDVAVTVETADSTTRTLAYGQIARARTVFEWGPGSSRPGGRGARSNPVEAADTDSARAGAIASGREGGISSDDHEGDA